MQVAPPPQDLTTLLWVILSAVCAVAATVIGFLFKQLLRVSREHQEQLEEQLQKEREETTKLFELTASIRKEKSGLIEIVRDQGDVLKAQGELLKSIKRDLPKKGGH